MVMPDYGDISTVEGNAPDYVKQLNYNVFAGYGMGDPECFGHDVGKAVRFVAVNIDRRGDQRVRSEATTVAEITVAKSKMTNP
jgi:acyl-coenzyme A thioesterase 13